MIILSTNANLYYYDKFMYVIESVCPSLLNLLYTNLFQTWQIGNSFTFLTIIRVRVFSFHLWRHPIYFMKNEMTPTRSLQRRGRHCFWQLVSFTPLCFHLDEQWTNLFIHPFFLFITHQIIRHTNSWHAKIRLNWVLN